MIALLQNEEVTNLEIDSLLDKSIRLKISRYEAYNSLMEILREYEVIMVEKNSSYQERFDYISDVLTGITGDTSKSSIIRFDGDPEDKSNFFENSEIISNIYL